MKGKSPIKHFFLIGLAVIAAILTGCSTQKNTAQSRWWHAFNARYNTYYNGTVAYIDGALEKEEGNRDNFTEQIPLYTVGNRNSRDLGKANFDRAIEKCEKAIHQHSIKRRPVWEPGRRKTAKDIEWLSRREYNPFLWKAWMLMGRSQFQKGDFEGAAATFAYMSRLYSTQPAIYGKARAWLAKCYIEQGWTYDAEDVIRNIQRDSIHWRAQKEWDYAFADYYIHTGDARKAIPYLRKVISHEMRHKQKARQWYLMGQLQASIGNQQEAYQAFRHVIRLNPPYELEFNARIAITEVLASGNSRKMISRLKRMAASDKNKEFQDQITNKHKQLETVKGEKNTMLLNFLSSGGETYFIFPVSSVHAALLPMYFISPESAVSKKVAQRRSVDLPEPEGPITDTVSPLPTLMSMPRSTSSPPKLLRMSFISSIMSAPLSCNMPLPFRSAP